MAHRKFDIKGHIHRLWWTPFFGHEKGLFLDGGRH
jgi:hypothetical protein